MAAIITPREVQMLADARRILRNIAQRTSDVAFSRATAKTDGVYEAYQLGTLRSLVETAGDGIFDVLNHAHNSHGVPVSDHNMFARPNDAETYFTIGFVPDACEIPDTIISNELLGHDPRDPGGFCCEIITSDGESGDYVLYGTSDNDGAAYHGHPLIVKRCNENHDPVGNPITVDALEVRIY